MRSRGFVMISWQSTTNRNPRWGTHRNGRLDVFDLEEIESSFRANVSLLGRALDTSGSVHDVPRRPGRHPVAQRPDFFALGRTSSRNGASSGETRERRYRSPSPRIASISHRTKCPRMRRIPVWKKRGDEEKVHLTTGSGRPKGGSAAPSGNAIRGKSTFSGKPSTSVPRQGKSAPAHPGPPLRPRADRAGLCVGWNRKFASGSWILATRALARRNLTANSKSIAKRSSGFTPPTRSYNSAARTWPAEDEPILVYQNAQVQQRVRRVEASAEGSTRYMFP